VGHRAAELGLQLDGTEIAELTRALKERAERGAMSQEEVNVFIRNWCQERAYIQTANAAAASALHSGSLKGEEI
jgi:hypothetical protein